MPDSSTLAALLAAVGCGAMLFFSFVVAPLVFIVLPAETAEGFVRRLFPVYYLTLAAVSPAFKRLHRLSVVINAIQIVVLAAAALRLAGG